MDLPLRSLSIFFPCYNDEGSIGDLVTAAISVGYELTDDLEVIVVEDGSVDGSRLLLEKMKTVHSELILVRHEKNRGYGAALRSGFGAASKEWVFYTDGDGQYDLTELPELVDVCADVDVVNGSKMSRSDPLYRRLIGKLYAWSVQQAFALPIKDIDCDFRLIRTHLVKQLDLRSDSGSICVELIRALADCGAAFREVPIHHYARRFGKSQFFQPTRITRTIIQLWELHTRLRRMP